MIGAVAKALRPVYLPLLQLNLAPPHLPEGTQSVRELRPSERYLAYRYFEAGLVLALLVPGLVVVAVLLSMQRGSWGVVVGSALGLLGLFVAGAVLVVVRMDWELRHYLIGDRSLRVRQGALVQQEVTLSFANVQNVEVTQGPLERIFGFQNLKVSTAGGGSSPAKGSENLLAPHGAVLVGLENAEEIRDLMLGELRRQKGAGLGDPDDEVVAGGAQPVLEGVLEAARALRAAAEGTSR